MRSAVITLLPFALMAAVAFVPDWPALGLWSGALVASGILLGLWAIAVMRLDRFHIVPKPRAASSMVESGPYRWIRHPMYTAVIVGFAGPLAADPSPLRIGLWIALVASLVVKLRVEEGLLEARFADYAAYRERTKRLVPGLY